MISNHRRIRILIIDDEESIRISLRKFLEDFDFDVTDVESAENALDCLKQEQFDIGIVDLRLPGISGDTFIQKAHLIQPDLHYVIHTGSVGYRLSIELMQLGLTNADVLHKPVDDLFVFVDVINQKIPRTPGK
ncbi:response regulator [bacterium]|nr:response regulator [candidate division CSSED10-310 bacterium]